MNVKKLLPVLSLVLLTACSTSQDEMLPEGSKNMTQIWAESTGGSTAQTSGAMATLSNVMGKSTLEARHHLVRSLKDDERFLQHQDFARNAKNETQNLFPRLPNPDLVMYVFPHMTNTQEALPVPGYTTVFPFYGRVQYAQMGEATKNI